MIIRVASLAMLAVFLTPLTLGQVGFGSPGGGFPLTQYAPGEPVTTYLPVVPAPSASLTASFQSSSDGIWIPAAIVSFGPDQFDPNESEAIVLIPENAPQGIGNIQFTVGDFTEVLPVQVIGFHYVPQLRPGDQTEAARAQQYSLDRGISENAMTTPARPGDWIILWGTGLGARPADRILSLTLSGVPAPVSWTGRTSGGLDLLEFTLPADSVPISCYVELDLQIDSVRYSAGLISTSDSPGSCHHPLGLSDADLETLDEGGYVPLVALAGGSSLSVGASGYSRTESFFAYLPEYLPPFGVWQASVSAAATAPVAGAIGATCRVPAPAEAGILVGAPPVEGTFGSFNPRTAVLNGPSNVQIPMEENPQWTFSFFNPSSYDPYSLSSTPPVSVPWADLSLALFISGTWSIDLPADAPYVATKVPFQIRQIDLTEPIQIPSLTQDFRARWNGSVFGPGDVVQVDFGATGGPILICTTLAQAGEMTVAAANLTWIWDAPRAVALMSARLNGPAQAFQIKQAGLPPRSGVFTWGQTINVGLKPQ
jgi:hypothetical protein